MTIFVEEWSKTFEDVTYSRLFYFAGLELVQLADSPTTLADGIVKLLHWKDGKVRESSQGAVTLGGNRWNLMSCKPNTYDPERHGVVFESEEFWHWANSVRQLNVFDPTKIEDIQGRQFNLWGANSIIIPSFVLHILNPKTFPLFDQHVSRAMRIILNQPEEADHFQQPTIQDYVEYQQFWQQLIDDLGLNRSSLEQIKQVDEALWSFGKWLKQLMSGFRQDKLKGSITDRRYSESRPRNQINGRTFTPDPEFKSMVMAMVRAGTTQREAMQIAADKLGVTLAPSYTKYPGSHIDRWRKQGY